MLQKALELNLKIKAGTFGDVSVFSFNATKLIMSGQGGCL